MEGTTTEGIIPSLFQGQYVVSSFLHFPSINSLSLSQQYVRCTKVDYESRVQQTFYDVPLQVRNSANSEGSEEYFRTISHLFSQILVTESFRDFCKSEILIGENLYDAGKYSWPSEAEKGVKFKNFLHPLFTFITL